MTSQVAVLNQRGVAVASDTVVTVSATDASGNRTTRTFSNRTKIQPIGDIHNVIVAFSGDVSANGVDVSLLVAEWGKCCRTSFDNLPDYVANFQEWLRTDQWLFSSESQVINASLYLHDYFTNIRDEVAELRDDTVAKRAVELYTLAAAAESRFELLLRSENHLGRSDESDKAWMRSASIDIEGLIDEVFDQRWDHLKADVEAARPTLKKIAPLVLSRIWESGSGAELNFLGYGSHDLFPRAIKVGFLGRYGDSDRIWIKEESDHTQGVLTIAQSSAIAGFVNGVSDDAVELLKAMLSIHLAESLSNPPSDNASVHAFIEELTATWSRMLASSHRKPLLDTIGCLALAELADLAESLVGIQALRANTSPEQPTVGGFIESLMIDRYDGVRWIKRLPR
jgi:hypothetical protein